MINCSAAEPAIYKELNQQEAVIGVDNGEIECSRFIHADTLTKKSRRKKAVLFGEAAAGERVGERCGGLVPSAE